MQGRRRNAEGGGGFLDSSEVRPRRIPRSARRPGSSIAAQIGDVRGLEAMTISGLAALTIKNAGDHRIWIMRGQAAHERDGILIGANDLWLGARQIHIELG